MAAIGMCGGAGSYCCFCTLLVPHLHQPSNPPPNTQVKCVYYVGTKDDRLKKYQQEVQSLQFNVLVTTYEFIMRDRTRLSKVCALCLPVPLPR